jgi:hypothetical protein
MRLIFAASIAALCLGCGYRPLRSGLAGHPHVRVAQTVSHLPGGDGATIGESAATGARAELARFGALSSSSSEEEPDVLTIELVRVDERSEGVAVGDDGKPHARGVRLRLTARGLVTGHGQKFETLDLDAFEVVATSGGDVLSWDAARTAAARGAARKVGAMVAREVLGVP